MRGRSKFWYLERVRLLHALPDAYRRMLAEEAQMLQKTRADACSARVRVHADGVESLHAAVGKADKLAVHLGKDE